MPHAIPIRLTGRELPGHPKPALLGSFSRSSGAPAADDGFLPSAYIKVETSFDVGMVARSAAGAQVLDQPVGPDEVLVIELADGSTLVTSAGRLKEALERNRPDLISADGAILFDRLRDEGPATRGFISDAIGGLVSNVFRLSVGAGGAQDAIIDSAQDKLVELLGDKAQQLLGDKPELGVSWLGTKALMWAIEEKLGRPPGKLYQWTGATEQGGTGELADVARLEDAARQQRPMLVFIHGTGSSTLGSFGDLQCTDSAFWAALKAVYPGGVYGFEHRSLSESPIQNALQLVEALPKGARVSLVTHSRGGLVGDLLCLSDIGSWIEHYHYAFKDGVGTVETADGATQEAREQQRKTEISRVRQELADQHAEHRADLTRLATALRDKALVVERYVRVASPAQGTRLASGNFDVFLSGLLSLIGSVPVFFGNPLYSAFKRVVIEIAKNRTNAHLVPGIEAMLPDSPMAALLRDAAVQPGIRMALIAGDIEGGNLLVRIGVLLTDFLLFDNVDHDLVVDTQAMLGGVAAKANARVLFDRGAGVSHFRYFSTQGTRAALRSWLVDATPEDNALFQGLPSRFEGLDALGVVARRSATRTDLPVVVVLPGVMGSYLQIGGKNRVWFDPLDIAAGGLSKIAWGSAGVEATGLFGMSYGAICEHLARSHRVEAFSYDWRQPLDVLGERLGEFLDRLLKQTEQPVRLLAHSMGGLVVRACIYRRRAVMDALMQREGARLVMLGTPHQGAHSMVENLLGKGDTLRKLVRLDIVNDMQKVLDIVSGFRGALQLLPKPGFVDTFQGQPEGGLSYEAQPYGKAKTWEDLQAQNTDFWFGDRRCGRPDQETLDSASWLWAQDEKAGNGPPSLPADYAAKSAYVFGVARNTACGVRFEANTKPPRLRMVGTTLGDGTVTWDSGRIGGIGSFYYMPGVGHGSLLSTREHFDAIEELLQRGATAALSKTAPTARAITQPHPVIYDPAPPAASDPASLALALLGGSADSAGPRLAVRASRRLEVQVKAMDLRFINQPLMVGHYDQDPIAGPERLIDQELLDGELSQRRQLGLYAGPLGTATIVLRAQATDGARSGHLGAVVTGLGPYDGTLGLENLRLAVRTGVLRYLLHNVDVLGRSDRELSLATLLLGFNSSANLTIAGSLEALVRGVIEANARFLDTTQANIRIARLDIVEIYRDTAITAVYQLRQTAAQLSEYASRNDTALVCSAELVEGEGARYRLLDQANAKYWPRLMVTDAERPEDAAALHMPVRPVALVPCTDPASGAGQAPARLANQLRFLYVGQRARAESIVQQRQPALIETLVQQQIGSSVWSDDFGRMLFQLVVPHDFKQAARDLQRVVLVLDSATANLPWELMLAESLVQSDRTGERGSEPLAIRVPVIRQLSSTAFRRQVRHTLARMALVIGNPSVSGFAKHFPDPANTKGEEPSALPQAETEAQSVAALLGSAGYTVKKAIGSHQTASAVLAALYQQPYRVLHVSAHGVFDLCHRDGQRRSGIVLSGGVLITAAEIASMEFVPELVFLNCCHLGQVDATVQGGNKLAASIARELIDIGVRCVVVAGWAVDDGLASFFGQHFYDQLLNRGQPFGDAVFEARVAVWTKAPRDITWGAFQAYGDPTWLAEPRSDADIRKTGKAPSFASPEELLDDLARIRVEASRKPHLQSDDDRRARVEQVKALLEQRCPAPWMALPAVLSALGSTWRDLGRPEEARDALLAAIQAEDRAGRVPIRDIEQLANVEARSGEKLAREALEKSAGGRPGTQLSEGLKRIDRSIQRLETLDALVATEAGGAQSAGAVHAERLALQGSAYKRKAAVLAWQLQAMASKDPLRAAVRARLEQALKASVEAYRRAEGVPERDGFSPYNALNRLALEALSSDFGSSEARNAAVQLAQRCGAAVLAAIATSTDPWNAVMQPEAILVAQLCSGALGEAGDVGDAAQKLVLASYADALSKLIIKPWQLDSVVTQLELLAGFSSALRKPRDGARKRVADRLLELARQLQPARVPHRKPEVHDESPDMEAAVPASGPPAETP